MKLAMRYTRNRADAEDFAQETFTKALVGLRHFRCECAFYTWLYRIATNSAKTAWSARARDPIDSTSDPQYDPAAADYPSQLQELETPEELAFADDLGGVVNATLEALPEELRTAIMLREIDSLTYEEIAAAMAIKVGTVRSRVFRARDEIDQQLRRLCASGLGRDGWRRSGPLLQLPTSPDAFSRSARHS
jgi:RNA polymerase sigma-70 factor (ECF subfamily)